MAIDQGVRAKKETRADAQSVIDLAHKQGLKIVDFKFIDLIGTWQHFSIPVQELTRGLFSEGIGFDGSSIRGFQHIHESDMLLIPDASTAIVDPVLRVPTLSINCDVIDPITREPYSRDPRYVGKKAEAFLLSTGLADTGYFGPECEFYIFNSMRFDQNQFSGMHTHQSLWKNGTPLFYDKAGYAGISDMCRWYIGGLLKHAASLLAFAAPTTNSYRRLVPGYEAPINLIYSKRNRSACVRIPMYFDDPKAKRLEFRPPDPSCNPYLSFAACLMAGLAGVINK